MKLSSARQPQFQAFTLIELLVVVAIIALLAAILFPVFNQAREDGRRASCQSNLRQLGLGFIQYTQDYDEYWPVGVGAAAGSAYGTGWAGPIYTYVKNQQVYTCPSDPAAPGGYWAGVYPGTSELSYVYNENFSTWAGNSAISPIMNAQLGGSSLTVVLSEGSYTGSTTGSTLGFYPSNFMSGQYQIHGQSYDLDSNSQLGFSPDGLGGWSNVSGSLIEWGNLALNERNASGDFLNCAGTGLNPGRHFGGGNFLLADGHVKWYLGSAVACGGDYRTKAAAQLAGETNPEFEASVTSSYFPIVASPRNMKDASGDVYAITYGVY